VSLESLYLSKKTESSGSDVFKYKDSIQQRIELEIMALPELFTIAKIWKQSRLLPFISG
jgi:hypothetical protein